MRLSSVEGEGRSMENVVTAARYADSNQRSVRNTKGICTVVALMVTMEAI